MLGIFHISATRILPPFRRNHSARCFVRPEVGFNWFGMTRAFIEENFSSAVIKLRGKHFLASLDTSGRKIFALKTLKKCFENIFLQYLREFPFRLFEKCFDPFESGLELVGKIS